MNLRQELETHIAAAIVAAGAEGPAIVAQPARAGFGDYQANGVMAAAKRAKTNPRQLAENVAAAAMADAQLAAIVEKIDIAGPGFLNIKLAPQFLAGRLEACLRDERLGVPKPAETQTVVIDYSAPNLAKEMHVGHLRSTIIGDSLARTLAFIGYNVIRQNHVGDWGTQFGMLIERMLRVGPAGEELADLERFYVQAKKQFDEDPDFAQAARQNVVRLQRGDAEMLDTWRRFRQTSMSHCQDVYRRIGVLLTDTDVRGESAYNDDLPKVVADLAAAGMLTESQGAQCVFLDEFKDRNGDPLPVIIQKSDEGFLYATTDLAGMRYRAAVLHARRILYVVDARQSLHFRQVFAVARKAGFVPPEVSLEHVGFGTMMGDDGKPFKTRSGGTVKLMALLDEAVDKAQALVDQKNAADVAADRARPLSDDEKRGVAAAVGIGAVKYADLSQNRNSDYVFSWDKMLALDGNTAPYMQYAYARVRSIFRKGEMDASTVAGAKISLDAPAERALAVKLLQLPETIAMVAAECLPNLLCGYLYDLATLFMSFYENCPVLQSAPAIRASRLALCDLTARTIRTGLGLLGIDVIEQM